MLNIEEFILTGGLHLIQVVKTQSSIIKILGNPDDIGNPQKKIQIYKYGNFQFSFYKNRLVMIAFYNEKAPRGRNNPFFQFTIDDFIEYLDKNSIEWEINSNYPIMADQFEIRLKNELSIIGDHDDDRIYSIIRSI